MKYGKFWKGCMLFGLGAALILGGRKADAADVLKPGAPSTATAGKSAAKSAESEATPYSLELTKDMEMPVTVSKTVEPGEKLRFTITVEESGWYTFGGSGAGNYYGWLENVTEGTNVVDWGFPLKDEFDAELRADTTYCLEVDPLYELSEEDTFTLTVRRPAFVIAERGQELTVPLDKIGDTLTITSGILQLDDSVQLSYEWYQITEDDLEIIPDATGGTYVLDGISSSMEFMCVTTDGNVTRRTFVNIDVDSGLAFEDGEDGVFEEVDAKPGETVTLKVNVVNPAGNELSYRWYKQEDNGTQDLDEATGDTLTIADISKSGLYGCNVDDGYMRLEKIFIVTVDSGFSVEHEVWNYVYPGGDLELSVSASTESGSLSYQWYDEEDNVIPGATEDHYMCSNILEECMYQCRVTDGYNTESAFFHISFMSDLSVEGDYYRDVAPGDSVIMEVTASSSYGELTYQWYDSEENPIEGAVESSYTVDSVMESQSYRCRVSDDYTSEDCYFYLNIDSGFDVEYESAHQVKYGDDVSLEIHATTESGSLTYQWYDQNDELLEEVTGNCYTVSNVTSAQYYTCLVSDGYNSRWIDFYISVDRGLSVSTNRENEVYVKPGGSASLRVDASTELGELSYEWYEGTDGGWFQLVEGAEGNVLEVGNVNASQNYYCAVMDGYNEKYIYFNIYVDSGFSAEAQRLHLADKGTPVNLTVEAQTSYGPLKYIWTQYDPEKDEEKTIAEGVSSIQVTGSGSRDIYYCYVSDAYNSKGIEITVTPASEGAAVREGENQVAIAKAGYLVYVPFVPQKTGTYEFVSVGEGEPYGYLMDREFHVLDEDDDSDGWNFKVSYQLKAGMTYYLGVRYVDDTAVGTTRVKISCLSEDFSCDHPYLTDWIQAQEATCTHGSKRERRCTVCGEVRQEEEDAKAIPHSFSAWSVVTAATAQKEGLESRVCTMCGLKETRVTAKLPATVTVKLNVNSLPLKVKQSTKAVKVVEKASGDTIASWSSSNKKVATVNAKGKITGKKKGTAIITVTMKSGAAASVKIKVQKKAVKTTKVKAAKKKITLKKGKSQTVKVEITPLTSLEKVKYTSSNSKIATVSAKGKITAKKPGKAKITVKSGKKKTVINVTVK